MLRRSITRLTLQAVCTDRLPDVSSTVKCSWFRLVKAGLAVPTADHSERAQKHIACAAGASSQPCATRTVSLSLHIQRDDPDPVAGPVARRSDVAQRAMPPWTSVEADVDVVCRLHQRVADVYPVESLDIVVVGIFHQVGVVPRMHNEVEYDV